MKIEDLECGTFDIPHQYFLNLQDLLKRMQEIEDAYGSPLIVTSGFRTMAQHKAIYDKLNKQRFLAGKSALPVPLFSNHLTGRACDIYDPDPMKDLRIWTKLNVPLLGSVGLWCEQFDDQPRVHYQSVQPKSGLRFFKP